MRLFIVASLVASLALAQQPAQGPPPKFRSGVDVVLLDVTALDANRRPIRGLTAADFTILEDGRPQPIVSFEELDSPEPDGSLVPWMREVASDVRTNSADNRRIILLILDDGLNSFRQNETVKQIGRKIIDQLGPADQVSIIFTGNNGRSQEFTNDRAVLRRTVERYVDTTVGMSAMQNSIQTIKKSAQTLLAIPHRRKAMILVSPLAVNAGNPNSDHAFQLQDALRQAQRANVTIYPINPAGLEVLAETGAAADDSGGRTLMSPSNDGPHLADDTAVMIANETGGFAVRGSNTFDKQVQQIFRETGSYYLVGFQSAHQDGKFRRIDVRTSRPGLTLRTRNGYNAPKTDKAEKKEKNVEGLPLMKAVASVLPSPDVPVRVVVAPFAGPAGKPVLAIVLGVQQPVNIGQEPAEEKVQLLSIAFDAQNYRQRAAYRQTVSLKLRPVEEASDVKYEIISKLDLEPGRYQIRFAAHSARLGKSGSVFQDVEIPDFKKAAVSLSGVILGVTPALPSAPRDFLAGLTPLAPTTQRTFLKEHQASAFLRVYQGGKKPPVPLVLTTVIVNDKDAEVHTSSRTLAAEAFTENGGVEHRFELPIERLEPGAYLLRFAVRSGRETAGRDVRFVVR